MEHISTIGLDTSKSVFQVHGFDAKGNDTLVKRLKRREVLAFFAKLPPCVVSLEACGSSHYWGREIKALGHVVKLVPPPFVKRFLSGRRKTDARDAKALALAGQSAGLRAVPVKSQEQQAEGMAVKVRGLLVRQHTQIGNSLRAMIAEFGHTSAIGDKGLEALIARVESADAEVPKAALEALAASVRQWRSLGEEIAKLTTLLLAKAKADPVVRRLMAVPGVGPLGAMVFVNKVNDPKRFKCGRDCSAWLGFVPNEHSTAGKVRRGSITKEGDEGLRTLMVLGAVSVLLHARRNPATASPWVVEILKRRPFKVAAVALAARNARTLWALLKHGTAFKQRRATAVTPPTAAAA